MSLSTISISVVIGLKYVLLIIISWFGCPINGVAFGLLVGEEDGDTLTPPEEDVDSSKVNIGDIMTNDDDEGGEPNYESMSKRDLEREIDLALDSGDMDLVRHLGSILNKK